MLHRTMNTTINLKVLKLLIPKLDERGAVNIQKINSRVPSGAADLMFGRQIAADGEQRTARQTAAVANSKADLGLPKFL